MKLEPPDRQCFFPELEVSMSSKNENVKRAVGFAHSVGLSRSFNKSTRAWLLSQVMSILSRLRSKRERIRERVDQISIPASLLLILTVPLILVCFAVASFAALWIATPIFGFGIAGGVLLFRHRSNRAQPFFSIIAQPTRSH
jgi:hypothetical protein